VPKISWNGKTSSGFWISRSIASPRSNITALAGTRRDAGVTVAEVNLKLIWDVVSQIKVDERGQA
jgi:hypothetical protein